MTKSEKRVEIKFEEFLPSRTRNIWLALIGLRFLLNTLVSQRGYIHPDEFFQGPEILAGDVFDCRDRVFRPWEFRINETSQQLPIRNIAIPGFFYGLPLTLLKLLASIGHTASHDGPIELTATTLIYYPRLFMTLFSLLVDLCLLKLADLLGVNKSSSLLTLASSYLSFVFLTRTFSNSIETLLFAILNYFIVRSLKSRNFDPNDGKLIGLILCLGIFNRPTFLIFAFIPTLYWILNNLEKSKSLRESISSIFHRAAYLSTYFMPASISLILIDTVYFYDLKSIDELVRHFQHDPRRLILTPYNFFSYNSKSENLAQHGSHPFYLHLVSCLILFGVNFVLLILTSLKNLIDQTRRGFRSLFGIKTLLKSISSLSGYLAVSFYFPLVVFSLIDHKEPRFLLPLLVPVFLSTSHWVFGVKTSWKIVRFSWLAFNLAAAIVFGCLHQGGVIPAVSYTQRMFTHTSNLEIDQHVIFYHTYMPPRYLVEAPVAFNLVQNKRFIHELTERYSSDEQFQAGDFKRRPEMPKRVIYDLMSSSGPGDVAKLVRSIRDEYTASNSSRFIDTNYAIFLAAPHVVEHEFLSHVPREFTLLDESTPDANSNSIVLRLVDKFYFHATFEQLQDHVNYITCNFDLESIRTRCLESSSPILNLLNSFSFDFYQVIV